MSSCIVGSLWKLRFHGHKKSLLTSVVAVTVIILAFAYFLNSAIIPSPEVGLAQEASTVSSIETSAIQYISLQLEASVDKVAVIRGDWQTIRVSVTDGFDPIDRVSIFGEIIYNLESNASFSGLTDSRGHYSYSWQIPQNIYAGVVTITIKASKTNFESSEISLRFNVNRLD